MRRAVDPARKCQCCRWTGAVVNPSISNMRSPMKTTPGSVSSPRSSPRRPVAALGAGDQRHLTRHAQGWPQSLRLILQVRSPTAAAGASLMSIDQGGFDSRFGEVVTPRTPCHGSVRRDPRQVRRKVAGGGASIRGTWTQTGPRRSIFSDPRTKRSGASIATACSSSPSPGAMSCAR